MCPSLPRVKSDATEPSALRKKKKQVNDNFGTSRRHHAMNCIRVIRYFDFFLKCCSKTKKAKNRTAKYDGPKRTAKRYK